MSAHPPQWSNLHWQDMLMPDANAGIQLAALKAAGPDRRIATARVASVH